MFFPLLQRFSSTKTTAQAPVSIKDGFIFNCVRLEIADFETDRLRQCLSTSNFALANAEVNSNFDGADVKKSGA